MKKKLRKMNSKFRRSTVAAKISEEINITMYVCIRRRVLKDQQYDKSQMVEN